MNNQPDSRDNCRSALLGEAMGLPSPRAPRPFVLTNLRTGEGVEDIARFIIEKGGLSM